MSAFHHKPLLRQAENAVQQAQYPPKKLALLHTGVAAGVSLVLTLLHYGLNMGISDTGGINGIGTRAMLETIQSLLQMLSTVLTPFWSIGFVMASLQLARQSSPTPSTLLSGFRRWGAVLRLTFLRVGILILGTIIATQVGSVLYALSPFSEPMMVLTEQMLSAGVADPAAMQEFVSSLDMEELTKLVMSVLPFLLIPTAVVLIPLSYRLRLSDFVLLDEPQKGALYAVVRSFQLSKKNCLSLFSLDLHLWWYYGLEILIAVLCYGDLLLPLFGIKLQLQSAVASLVFYVIALVCQLGLYTWKKAQIATTYALFYHNLLPNKQPQ